MQWALLQLCGCWSAPGPLKACPGHIPDVALDNLWLRVEPPLQVNVLGLAEGWLRQRLQDNGTGP